MSDFVSFFPLPFDFLSLSFFRSVPEPVALLSDVNVTDVATGGGATFSTNEKHRSDKN